MTSCPNLQLKRLQIYRQVSNRWINLILFYFRYIFAAFEVYVHPSHTSILPGRLWQYWCTAAREPINQSYKLQAHIYQLQQPIIPLSTQFMGQIELSTSFRDIKFINELQVLQCLHITVACCAPTLRGPIVLR